MIDNSSHAGSNEGTEEPQDESYFSKEKDGEVQHVGIRWSGEEYDPRQAWIRVPVHLLMEKEDTNNDLDGYE